MYHISLGFDVNCFVTPNRVHDDRAVQPAWSCRGKTGVPIRVPLHGSPNTVAVAEIDVISHADFVPVIQDRSAGK